MRKATLPLSILLLFIFSGCEKKCEPKIIVEKKYIKTKPKKYPNLKPIKDCVMGKGVDFGDLNTTLFWVDKQSMVNCSNVSMRRKDKNIIYERQNIRG